MDISTNNRETCHDCSKSILTHNSFIICKTCQKICHAKCAKNLYTFDFIDGNWCCRECSSLEETRYNPFKSYRYDKYSQPDNENFNEIHQVENLLNCCNRYTFFELNNHIRSSDELSIMFKNIDGVTSNFDQFTTELMTKCSNLSVISLAETNLDECNKQLFQIRGYESIYQSKMTGKHKGSGLAVYLKDNLIFTKMDDYCQCSPNLESLFISINNDKNPVTIGVLYRPPNGDEKSFLLN